ncbi:delta-aminolevulinic acid dehydratase isoform X2 [Pectinophora gossypiella]|uniref:delta-aminolevulinic acid dehydratase isoform X2 n=1 Tax=Pectinophora gossypiella TaxID=13191 RepID=UPI00214EF59F|nr:delta-aminolevulinic acid dehydratase isoform X2 [Pectinophora gossypiella]
MNDLFLRPEHVLQGGYFHSTLRKLQEPNTSIEPHNIMYPVFLLENEDAIQPVGSMPNVHRYGVNQLIPALTTLVDKGLKSILIFGIVETMPKDPTGSSADDVSNPVIKALPKLRDAFPQLLIACDVCLCPYTSHGHCGVLTNTGAIDHAASVKRIAEVALAYAKAGAHVVAPSDMMDNRIKAIKDALISHKLQNQARDVAEGADFLMVKPGLPYLDIVKQTKDQFPNHPLFIYQVSGEYAMISRSGDSNEVQTTLMETLTCMRRAGADCIITYFAPVILSIISGKH